MGNEVDVMIKGNKTFFQNFQEPHQYTSGLARYQEWLLEILKKSFITLDHDIHLILIKMGICHSLHNLLDYTNRYGIDLLCSLCLSGNVRVQACHYLYLYRFLIYFGDGFVSPTPYDYKIIS